LAASVRALQWEGKYRQGSPITGRRNNPGEVLMNDRDAASIAQLLLRLGLVTEDQLNEAWDEVGRRNTDPFALLRVLERKGLITPYQSHKLLKGDEEGYFLGGYRILYKISAGSFGRVYRADDPGSGRVVAIKVLRRRWSEDPQRIELFDREGKVGLSLRHPNIVEILAVSHDAASGQYFIVMEFVEGGNLREILQIRKKLEPAEALRPVERAPAGLSAPSSRGVTHRDMKLTNILVSSQGPAKLVDFGLAKIYSSGVKDSEKVERTVDYAGLEKATGVKSGDVRSDIYFLGCVLYEILSGRPPLPVTRDRHARMQKQRFDNVPPLPADEVNARPVVFRLVETMMARNPQHRFQTPSQLLDAIRAARRELENPSGPRPAGGGGGPAATRSVFVVEKKERYQEAIREKFKELGYRVFLSADPGRALDRFRQQPFDALVIDAATTGEDGMLVFDRIITDAERQGFTMAGILVLNAEDADWARKVKQGPNVAIMVHPGVTLKQLSRKLQELVPGGPPQEK